MTEYLSRLNLNEEFLKIFQSAVGAMTEGISIADARKPDMPLIFVNKGFVEMTGYSASETVGRNCRFLQGEHTDPETVRTIREAINQHARCVIRILNYRKNGEPFWNRLAIIPIFSTERELTHYVGVQYDLGNLTEVNKLEQRRLGMLATLATLSNQFTDLMVHMKYLRLKMEESPENMDEHFRDFDQFYDDMLDQVEAIFSLRDYKEVELSEKVTGIAVPEDD